MKKKQTMDTVQSWVDADQVRRLAEGLMEPAAKSGPAQGEATLPAAEPEKPSVENTPTGKEGVEVKSPHPVVSKALETARKMAEGSGMLKATSPAGDVPEKSKVPEVGASAADVAISAEALDASALLPLSQKWAESFGIRAMIVFAGREKVLLDVLDQAMLTRMAERMAKSVPDDGHLVVKVGAGANMQMVSIDGGRLCLGLLLATPLSLDQLKDFSAVVLDDLAKQ